MKSFNRNKNNRLKKTTRQLVSRNGAAPGNGHALMVADPTDLSNAPLGNGEVQSLAREWQTDSRWRGVKRAYNAEKVLRLRGSMKIEYTIADKMSRKLWDSLCTEPYVN